MLMQSQITCYPVQMSTIFLFFPPRSKLSVEMQDKANIIISKGHQAVVKHTLTMCMSTPYISSHLALFK